MNRHDGLTASHIMMDETRYSELVGCIPTPSHYKSEVFFKEDTPLDAERVKYMSEYNGPMTFVAHKHKIRGRRL